MWTVESDTLTGVLIASNIWADCPSDAAGDSGSEGIFPEQPFAGTVL
jgi:hypothetical protein